MQNLDYTGTLCLHVTETIFLSSYHRVSKKIVGSLSVGGNVS